MDAGEIKKHADKLVKIYINDLESYLGNELIQYKEFCKFYIGEKREFKYRAMNVQVTLTKKCIRQFHKR